MRFTFTGIVAALTVLTPLCLAFADEEKESAKLGFSGVLEEELGYIIAEGGDESDFAIAKVELGGDVSLGPNVDGHVLFLYEQGENNDNIVVDEGTISLRLPITLLAELSLSLGRTCIPFGEFNSHFVTDPFSLDIGETHQVALQVLASHEIVEFSTALYNEEVDIEGGNSAQINDIAVRLAAFVPEGAMGRDMNVLLGASLITNMAGTDGLTDMIRDGKASETAMGLGSFTSISFLNVFLEGELVLALSNIKLPDGGTLKPRAFNVELGYCLPFSSSVEIAGKFEQLSVGGDNSTNRFGGVVSMGLFGDTACLALEYLRTDDGNAAENSIVGQVAVEF